MIREQLWRLMALIVTIPAVTDWLIARARRTPYSNITSRDGTDVYMVRLWLFNPYGKDANGDPAPARWPRLPSIRLHHILRADDDFHCHDHPWNARTIVLERGYDEERPTSVADAVRTVHYRQRGYTGRILFGQYHRISHVPPEGVWTMFITWEKQGTWGFLVDGQKVPWRQYLAAREAAIAEQHTL